MSSKPGITLIAVQLFIDIVDCQSLKSERKIEKCELRALDDTVLRLRDYLSDYDMDVKHSRKLHE